MTGPHAITCPSCGGSIELAASGYTVSLACRYCGALLDVASEEVRLLAAAAGEVAALGLPLGTRGTIGGIEWAVIGWQSRSAEGVAWEEYLLFNPYAGYRWLVHADAVWQLGTMITDLPEWVAGDNVRWQGHLFETEGPAVTATTTRVLGEFYWRVRTGDTVQAASFARGSETLSLEVDADEINWTHLVTLSPAALRAAFGDHAGDGPQRPWGGSDGGNATQQSWWRWDTLPDTADGDLRNMVLTCIAATIVMIGGMAVFGKPGDSIGTSTQIAIDAPGLIVPVGTITVTGVSRAVTITAASDNGLDNNWVDFDVALVDRRTQRAIPASGTLEYYYGRDADGSWSEGSHSHDLTISSVPAGTYDVIVDAEAHHWIDPKAAPVQAAPDSNPWGIGSGAPGPSLHLWLWGQVGGFEWGVFFTALALISAPPLILGYLRLKNRKS